MPSSSASTMFDLVDGHFPHDATGIPEGDRVLPMFSLKGRTAIVTGAGAGIGLGVAQAYAEAGANVAIWYNTNKQAVDNAAKIEQTYGVKCKAYPVNVTSPEAVDTAITEIIREFNGRLDVFVANSGIVWTEGDFIDGSVKSARSVIEVNLLGVMWCAKSAGAHFRRQKLEGTTIDGKPLENYLSGSFIATASMSAHIINIPQRQTPYNTSKAAVLHFCKSLAVEWAGFARVNSVSPGYILTEISSFVPEEAKKTWKDKIPMGRQGVVNELKGAYLFLACDASSYATGSDVVVDGGYCLP